jgi:hypothetical protein
LPADKFAFVEILSENCHEQQTFGGIVRLFKKFFSMKKNYFILLLAAGSFGSLAFVSTSKPGIERAVHRNSSGAPAGRTGAPGETNCTACHSGSAQSGAGINTVLVTDGSGAVTDYVPGTTYTVAVALSNGGSSKNGFEIVALTPSNTQAGTITAIPGSGAQVINGSGGKKYVTHTAAGNTQSAWAFQWTAPATNVGNVRFYLATNQTNSSGTESGDIIRLSQHDLGSFASVTENSQNEFEAGFSAATNVLHVNLRANAAGDGTINLTDMNGRSVFTEKLGKISGGESSIDVRLPENLPAGVYQVHIGVDNSFAWKKIAILK